MIHTQSGTGHPDQPFVTGYTLPVGISLIAAVAEEGGHETEFLALNVCSPKASVDRLLERFQPDVVGFSVTCQDYPVARVVAQHVRERAPESFLLIGGPHATLVPDRFIDGLFDAVCVGEGEYPTLDLLNALEGGRDIRSIPNLWVIQGEEVFRNPTRPFMRNLDELPIQSWKNWDRYTMVPGVSFPILLSRGCAFDCTYCSNHALKEISAGRYVRFRTVPHILRELEALVQRYPETQLIFLETEMLNVNKAWVRELCEALRDFNAQRERPIAFRTNFRILPNYDWDEFFQLLYSANVRSLFFGLESGAEQIRSEILLREYSNEEVIRLADAAKRAGVFLGTYVLVGVPQETRKEYDETVAILRELNLDTVVPFVFNPYPGTKLWEDCIDAGLTKPGEEEYLSRARGLDMPDFSRESILEAHGLMTTEFCTPGMPGSEKILAKEMTALGVDVEKWMPIVGEATGRSLGHEIVWNTPEPDESEIPSNFGGILGGRQSGSVPSRPTLS